VVINDLIEGTFYARLNLVFQEEEVEIDSRPSDAIALAVRFGAPIYVSEEVIKQASIVAEEGEEIQVEKFREFLEKLNPEDFEK
jgi:bifunctional DNase/RNase